jgi:beta-1,2-mannobiose phosphorylase / 1,2-beta-oligomannan phosphorylase
MIRRFRRAPLLIALLACAAPHVAAQPALLDAPPRAAVTMDFPRELVHWTRAPDSPVFTAAGDGHWDKHIRERGWILRHRGGYQLWYTGYDGTYAGIKQLGYAASQDGIHWTRSPSNPLVPGQWVEDMMIVPYDDGYAMFAEGGHEGDNTSLLTSPDGVDWTMQGVVTIRTAGSGENIELPYGTPTAWLEDGVWHLFYERGDLGVWLATTEDLLSREFTNVQDEPVLELGASGYDCTQIALDQIIRHEGVYYAIYHACGAGEPRVWNTSIARSDDLVHWEKYAGNPIVDVKSSGQLVPDGSGHRLYTMHAEIDLFMPSTPDSSPERSSSSSSSSGDAPAAQ